MRHVHFPETSGAGGERLQLMPATGGFGPAIPDAPLWEQWRDIYAARGADELEAEAEALLADEDRLSRSAIPEPMALAMIGMRLTLIEERLAGL